MFATGNQSHKPRWTFSHQLGNRPPFRLPLFRCYTTWPATVPIYYRFGLDAWVGFDTFSRHVNITAGSFYPSGNESVKVESYSSKPLGRYFSKCPLWVESSHSPIFLSFWKSFFAKIGEKKDKGYLYYRGGGNSNTIHTLLAFLCDSLAALSFASHSPYP